MQELNIEYKKHVKDCKHKNHPHFTSQNINKINKFYTQTSTDRHTEIKTDRHTEIKTDRHTDRLTDIHSYLHKISTK